MKETDMKLTTNDHNICLHAAQKHKEAFTEDEILALNDVAGSWAGSTSVSDSAWEKAQSALQRVFPDDGSMRLGLF